MNLARRSYKKELLDRNDIPFNDIRQNMEELDFINKYLGGHNITIAGIRELFSNSNREDHTEWLICEIGCGGGDNMIAIQNWCRKSSIPVRFIGIDINPFCIKVASRKLAAIEASFITADYISVFFKERKPDFIFSSLFCHHFANDDLVRMLCWMQANAQRGFFINDLHRHYLAYYSIKLLTGVFSQSYLVKNDAPLSVARGFKKEEWENLLGKAGIKNYSIKWKWAFRHLVTVRTLSGKIL